MSSKLDLSKEFANHVVNTRYENLSSEAIETAKKSILDILGVILAGSGMEPAVRGVADVILGAAGGAESSVLGFGGKAPAPMAAFANGVMAHCLDFDDQTPWGAHPDSSVVPAVLAVAERVGGISGRDLITAVALGQDLFVRLRCNVEWRQDWNLSSVVGVFSAAAAAAHVLKLNREQVAHALGIASMQSGGTMELVFGIGSDLRGMYAGFTAQGAVLAPAVPFGAQLLSSDHACDQRQGILRGKGALAGAERAHCELSKLFAGVTESGTGPGIGVDDDACVDVVDEDGVLGCVENRPVARLRDPQRLCCALALRDVMA